jgi:hypothetical protein
MLRALLALGLLILAGCTLDVRPKPVPAGTPATTIYLLENGMHGSLVLPTGDGSLVCFDYGEWKYYAQANMHWTRVFPALFWPTAGTLARRQLPPGTWTAHRLRLIMAADHVWAVPVSAERAAAVLARLDARFAVNAASRFYDPELDTWFVREDDQPYHVFRTCNRELAGWLRELDLPNDNELWAWDVEVHGAERDPPR